jgi:hypothetical protein
MSPKVQPLKDLKNEMELYYEVVAHVKELNDKHLEAYKAVKKE